MIARVVRGARVSVVVGIERCATRVRHRASAPSASLPQGPWISCPFVFFVFFVLC